MRTRVLVIFLVLLFFLLIDSDLGARTMDFETFNLENGAKIKYLQRSNIPIVYLSVLIKASPLDESKPSQAYLTAQLLTHGTKNHSAREIEDLIDFLAISIEQKVTNDYTLITLSTTKRHFKEAIDLFFEILRTPTFPEEEFKKEVSKLEKFLRQIEQDPSYIGNRQFLKSLFGDLHPYGRPVEGLPDKLSSLTREDVLSFYSNHYTPSNMIFTFVGDISKVELEKIKKKYLLNWYGSKPKREIGAFEIPKREKSIEIKIKREELTQATIIFGFEGISRKDPEFFSFSLMNYMIGGGGLTSRLARAIREEQGLAYSVYSTFTPYLVPGAFYIEVKTKADNSERVKSMIIEELKKFAEKGITEEELKEAKAFMIGSFPLRLDTMKKICEFLPLLDFYGLGDDYISKYSEYINSVTVEQIKKTALRTLKYNNYVLIAVGP